MPRQHTMVAGDIAQLAFWANHGDHARATLGRAPE
jgi:hypothetical protein